MAPNRQVLPIQGSGIAFLDLVEDTEIIAVYDTIPLADSEPVRHKKLLKKAKRSIPYFMIAALVGWIFFDFSTKILLPNIQGFTLSQSWRLVLGQVPHRDFLSAKPAGSGLLHLVDWIVPLKLATASKLVCAAEFVIYSFLFARIIYGRKLSDWSPLQIMGAVLATVVNLHEFPITAWHTTDGLFCISSGLVLYQNGAFKKSSLQQFLGVFVIGCAILMKQSFAPALLFAIPIIWHSNKSRSKASWAAIITVYVMPIALYCAVISALGGWHQLFQQIILVHVPKSAFVIPVQDAFKGLPGQLLVALITGLLLMVFATEATPRVNHFAKLNSFLAMLIISALIFETVPEAMVGGSDHWGVRVTVLLALIAMFETIRWNWSNARLGFFLIGSAWMVSLSYGYPTPRLIAGSVLLGTIYILSQHLQLPKLKDPGLEVRIATSIVMGTTIAVVIVFGSLRSHAFIDRITSMALDSNGTEISPQPTPPGYTDVKQCISQYPARYVAILPAEPGVNAVLRLHNPFPIDLMNNVEVGTDRQRILDVSEKLNNTGDYFVLFNKAQLQDADGAVKLSELYVDSVVTDTFSSLNGTQIDCGAFVGIYSAPKRAA